MGYNSFRFTEKLSRSTQVPCTLLFLSFQFPLLLTSCNSRLHMSRLINKYWCIMYAYIHINISTHTHISRCTPSQYIRPHYWLLCLLENRSLFIPGMVVSFEDRVLLCKQRLRVYFNIATFSSSFPEQRNFSSDMSSWNWNSWLTGNSLWWAFRV